MTEAERGVLELAAAHSLITVDQVQEWRGEDAVEALPGMTGNGLLSRVRLASGDLLFSITERGLQRIESSLPVPSLPVTDLRAVIAAGWAWVVMVRDHQTAGVEVFSRRQLIARDCDRPARERWGQKLPGFAVRDLDGVVYSDVRRGTATQWAAVHVFTATPATGWLLALLRAYGADERYRYIEIFAEGVELIMAIEEIAARAGVASVTTVRPLWLSSPSPVLRRPVGGADV